MPVEYNWVGDDEDLAKLRRESRRGEWEAVGERQKRREKVREAEKDRGKLGWGGGNLIIPAPSQISEPRSWSMSWPVNTDNMLDNCSCLLLLHMFRIYSCSFFSPSSPSLPALLFSIWIWKVHCCFGNGINIFSGGALISLVAAILGVKCTGRGQHFS